MVKTPQYMGMSTFSETDAPVELKDYWTTIRRRWRVVVLCLVAALAAAAFLTWQATPQYASSARIFVSTSESDTSAAYQGGLFATQRVASYADLVKSRQLAARVNDELGGDLDPDDLTGQVTAEVVPETVILEITATDPDPVVARDIAQAYVEGLRELVADLETPSGQSNALIRASIVDNAQVSTTPSRRSRCGTSVWRLSSGCCSASAWPWPASCWTPRSPPPTTSPR